MSKSLNVVMAGLLAAFVASSPVSAAPMMGVDLADSGLLIQVSGGCGPNGWRGPWGRCRNTPYYGPLPGGYYQERPAAWNSCPPGYWRGPWGHCRNTPYHGNLPGGGWKP